MEAIWSAPEMLERCGPGPVSGRDGGGTLAAPSALSIDAGLASGIPAAMIGQPRSLETTTLENQANSSFLSDSRRAAAGGSGILQSRMIAALDEFKAALEQAIPSDPRRRWSRQRRSWFSDARRRERLAAAASSASRRLACCRCGVAGRAAWFGGEASAAGPARTLPADPGQVSVAGISSGAFMANQLHIAHSAGIMGAGIVAGGPFGCAVDRLPATHSSSQPSPSGLHVRAELAGAVASYQQIARPCRERLDRSLRQPRSQPRLPVHRAGRHGRQLQVVEPAPSFADARRAGVADRLPSTGICRKGPGIPG